MAINTALLSLLEGVLGEGKKTSGSNVAFMSPFMAHYKPKLEINLDTTHGGRTPWHCWISNRGGHSIRSLLRQMKVPREAFQELDKILGKDTILQSEQSQSLGHLFDAPHDKNYTPVFLPEEFIPLWTLKTSSDRATRAECNFAEQYLNSRGVTKELCLRHGIGYCTKGEYAGRVIIPSYNEAGIVNYFVGRSVYDGGISYKNPPISNNVVGFESMIDWQQPVVLVEGVFDAIAIRRNAIPLFGKALQGAVTEKLVANGVPSVYVCLDRDALEDAMRIVTRLNSLSIETHLVVLDGDTDPSDVGFAPMLAYIQNADVTTELDLITYKMGL